MKVYDIIKDGNECSSTYNELMEYIHNRIGPAVPESRIIDHEYTIAILHKLNYVYIVADKKEGCGISYHDTKKLIFDEYPNSIILFHILWDCADNNHNRILLKFENIDNSCKSVWMEII